MRKLISFILLSLISFAVLAKEPCAPDFATFLSRFESDNEFQKRNTYFPLSATYVDGASYPEPSTVEYKINSENDPKYSRLIYPSEQMQVSTPFKMKVTSKQGIHLVRFTKPDTDYSFAFSFEKTSSCWQLVKFDDYSL
ncbi:MAG: hypothetical protein KJ850_00780 [Gammaproteobacteria bacterium]|nr:hypothetical protein [Gammaproteobacteria bacterium]MBU1623556.1 hypothetical protein [Gammaproteobacteria bacterium]